MTEPRCSRLAPSPTGALHLGNARTFLVNWAIARRRGWILPLRIEDLDGPRIKPETITETIELLRWLGLDWDGETLVQSSNLDVYATALRHLLANNHIYHCNLTRKEIDSAAAAPHEGEVDDTTNTRPSDVAAHNAAQEDNATNWRFIVPTTAPAIIDQFSDTQPRPPKQDPVIWTRRNAPAYQLAVVVDDARQGVTDVVRGNDLLPSAVIQEAIHKALGQTPPTWWHLPLVRGEDGRRLAKRHGDSRLSHWARHGVSPERIIGLLAFWNGTIEEPHPMQANEFMTQFDINTLPKEDITYTKDHESWLLAG